jgi:hypothetical protein
MTKLKALLFLLLPAGMLFCQNSFPAMMDSLLQKHPSYQQTVSRYEREKALFTIDKSLDWFDLNFIYRQYDNDFIRDETVISLEHSDVEEKDKRWRIELNKQFFPKDFDNVKSALGSRLDLLRYRQEARLAHATVSAEILDDMIAWFQAEKKVSFLQSRLYILYRQKELLDELDGGNQLSPDLLIANLEEIEKREQDLSEYKRLASVYQIKYGDILPVFLDRFQSYMKGSSLPDSLSFIRKVVQQTNELKHETGKITGKIKIAYFHFFLPEINLNLSYNWRETKQDWDIEQNNIFKNKTVKQNEVFPEGELELSLPFNLISNSAGKLSLLKAYERELQYRSKDLQDAWQNFASERLSSYQAANLELSRKTRLSELYTRKLEIQMDKYREEPSILGNDPELKLQGDTVKADEARAEAQIAEMKLYKEIFLINSLGEDIK